MREYKPLRILSENGWEWKSFERDMPSTSTDFCQYTMIVLGNSYSSTVVAIVSQYREHLQLDGHYGVLWLEAKYEYDRNGCLSWGDMEDMMCAIENAEENLLTIGMPFTEDYQFHGRNISGKKRRNAKLRQMYGLAEKEKEE